MKYIAAIVIVAVAVVAIAGFAWYVTTSPHPSPPKPSILNVSLATTPTTTFTKLVMRIALVEVHDTTLANDTGWTPLQIQTSSVDLLKLTNVSALLGTSSIPAGNYSRVRISISSINATVAANGTTVSVFLFQNFLLAERAFTINASEVVSFTLNLNLALSFAYVYSQWYFLPSLGKTIVSKG